MYTLLVPHTQSFIYPKLSMYISDALFALMILCQGKDCHTKVIIHAPPQTQCMLFVIFFLKNSLLAPFLFSYLTGCLLTQTTP